MINQLIKEDQFTVRWVGCDSAFGCDHNFLDGLPDSVYYFAAVKENEYIYFSLPTIDVPSISSGKGRKAKYPRALEDPISVVVLACDETVPWVRRVLGYGSKGPIVADVKCVRVFNCRSVNNVLMPLESVWAYIRKYEDGTLKYFVSNAPADIALGVLDGVVLMRWSIEQCFLECKSYLGMGHYETRSYASWHRYMLLVFVAHFFVLVLWDVFKKRVFF
jgi:SRSO17 transposase